MHLKEKKKQRMRECSRKDVRDARRGGAQLNTEKGLRVDSTWGRSLSFNLAWRVLDIEDFELDGGAIGSNMVKEHEYRSSSKSHQSSQRILVSPNSKSH